MNILTKKQVLIFLIMFLMLGLIASPTLSVTPERSTEKKERREFSSTNFDLQTNDNRTPPAPPSPPGGITIPAPNETIQVPGNGSSVTINPGESIELVTPTGISLVLIANESLNLSINVLDENPSNASLPSGFVDVGVFLEIEANNTDADVNASISIPLDPTALENMGANASNGMIMFYNETSGQWEPALTSVVDLTNGMITGYTDHFSTWTAVFEIEQAPPTQPPTGPPEEIPIPNGTPVQVVPGQSVILTTPSGISISLVVGESVQITVTELPSNPKAPLPESMKDFGLFLEIEVNESTELNASISIPFDPNDLQASGIPDPSGLTLAYFDEVEQKWILVPSQVDITNKVVSANVTHFSVWSAVYVESESGGEGDGTTQAVSGFTALGLMMTIVALAIVYRRRK